MPPARDRLDPGAAAALKLDGSRQEQRKVIVNAYWLYVDKASRMAASPWWWACGWRGTWARRTSGDLNYALAFVGLVGILARSSAWTP